MALPPDTLAEQVAYNVSGDVACTENWPAIRDSILKRAQEAIAAEREACAQVAEAKAQDYLSPQYATGQPLSSFAERFACKQIAKAIRERR